MMLQVTDWVSISLVGEWVEVYTGTVNRQLENVSDELVMMLLVTDWDSIS